MSRTYRKVPGRQLAKSWYRDGNRLNELRNGRVEVLKPYMPDGHWFAGPSCWCEWCRCEEKHRILRQLDNKEMSEAILNFEVDK